MKILFTLCARKGSKGLKNKNLLSFVGYPLPFYTISVIDLYARKNLDVDIDIVLNTDSIQLIDIIKNNIKIKIDFIERKLSLAGDNVPKIEVIRDSYYLMADARKKEYDYIVDLDFTSPLRTLQDLENLIEKRRNSHADVVFSVTKARRNPYFNMVKKLDNGYYGRVINSNFNARQEAPAVFDMNASMYGYLPGFLRSKKGIFDGTCDIVEMVDSGILDIDDEEDFELMQVVAKYFYDTKKDYRLIRDNIEKILIN